MRVLGFLFGTLLLCFGAGCVLSAWHHSPGWTAATLAGLTVVLLVRHRHRERP